jgi:hypothetical protein
MQQPQQQRQQLREVPVGRHYTASRLADLTQRHHCCTALAGSTNVLQRHARAQCSVMLPFSSFRHDRHAQSRLVQHQQ